MRLWGYPCGAAGSLGDPPFVTLEGPRGGGQRNPRPASDGDTKISFYNNRNVVFQMLLASYSTQKEYFA